MTNTAFEFDFVLDESTTTSSAEEAFQGPPPSPEKVVAATRAALDSQSYRQD